MLVGNKKVLELLKEFEEQLVYMIERIEATKEEEGSFGPSAISGGGILDTNFLSLARDELAKMEK